MYYNANFLFLQAIAWVRIKKVVKITRDKRRCISGFCTKSSYPFSGSGYLAKMRIAIYINNKPNKRNKLKKPASQLTAACLYINPPANSYCAGNTSFLQSFLKLYGTIVRCGLAFISHGRIEGNCIDMTQQPF